MYNAIMDKYVERLEQGKNGSAFIQGEMPEKMEDLTLFTLPCRLWESKPFDTLADLGSCVDIIPLYLFKKLKIKLLEENDHVFGLADGTKSYLVGIVRNVEVHIGKLRFLNDFYVINMEKDPTTPLLVGRGFLATANAVIDCRKAKIAVGEGITRSIFEVKGIDPGEEEAPYWTTLSKRESYKPRPSSDGIGTRGVVGLTRWFKKMETTFHISNCPERYQVKYATCTLLDSALTWWNAHKRTIRADNVSGQSVARAYTVGNNKKRGYDGPLPYCNKCTDKSFVSSTFSALLDVIPSMLDVSYAVELADERVAKTNTVLRGYTL
nr:hypothetical protein [Tanacetum cinerariifolium]